MTRKRLSGADKALREVSSACGSDHGREQLPQRAAPRLWRRRVALYRTVTSAPAGVWTLFTMATMGWSPPGTNGTVTLIW